MGLSAQTQIPKKATNTKTYVKGLNKLIDSKLLRIDDKLIYLEFLALDVSQSSFLSNEVLAHLG